MSVEKSSGTGNLILDSINELRSGGSTVNEEESDVSDDVSEDNVDSGVQEDAAQVDGDQAAGNDAPVDSVEASDKALGKPAEKSEKPAQISDKEVITVSDEQGKRRKIEIDYSNRELIKKQFEMALGARKWQAEKDRAVSESRAAVEKLQKLEPVLEALGKAYQEGGELAVIDLLADKPGKSQEWLDRQIARAKFFETASPKEIEAFKQQERLEKLERDLARREEAERKAAEERAKHEESMQLESLKSTVNPIFERYRFDGKLGDAEDEALFDKLLWTEATGGLKPYEEQGVPLTRDLVDKQFREVSIKLRKRMNIQAEKKAAAVVEQKKEEAVKNVQASTMNAYSKNSARQERDALIEKGDLLSVFRNFGRLGKR